MRCMSNQDRKLFHSYLYMQGLQKPNYSLIISILMKRHRKFAVLRTRLNLLFHFNLFASQLN